MFNKINEFFEKIKKNKIYKIILICILSFLILFIFFYDKKESTKKDDTNKDIASLYVEEMQKNLKNILSQINGVGNVDVMISIESGMETVLATSKTTKETSNGIITEETPILLNGKTVVLKEQYPQIQGVVVVCEGAKNISVVNAIINATSSLLGINNNKIQVIKMK